MKSVTETVDIQAAKILVSGGRGVGSAENFALLDDLAEALGGTVSCSRAVVETDGNQKIYRLVRLVRQFVLMFTLQLVFPELSST